MRALKLIRCAGRFCGAIACAAALLAHAQTEPAAPPATVPGPLSLDALAWLHGCWEGKVTARDFREEWLPLHGEMMVGASQTVLQGKTTDFEYLRLESRPDGIFYVAAPGGKKESSFRLKSRSEDGHHEIFTFENVADEFPQRLVYRRGTQGWLYASVEGKVNGEDRRVIYPMRRVDCATGALADN